MLLRYFITKKGFTLVELIIVVFIIGIALGLASVVFYKSREALEINTFTKELASTLRFAQSRAVAEKKIYSVGFSNEERTLRVSSKSAGYRNSRDTDTLASKDVPDSLEVLLKNKEGISDTFQIEFYPQGTSSGGIIEISDNRKKPFYIKVNRLSGKVEIQREDIEF